MNKKILIVDDEPALLTALVDKFTREGFFVTSAKDGQEGLNSALTNHPDLILLDIILPVKDGMTMLCELRKDAWGKTVPVILLTNLSEAEMVAGSLSQGIHEYLVKSDWKLDDIAKKVKEKLNISK